MLELPISGRVTWPSNRAPAFVCAEIERQLQQGGGVGLARSGHRIGFERLPLRQLFHAFYVQDGSFEVSSPGTDIQVAYRASTPVLTVLVPFLLVALLMGAMAVQSGAPVAHIAGVLVVAAIAFVFAIRAAAGFGLRRLALAASAASKR